MEKMVKKIQWNLGDFASKPREMYAYVEANFEANDAMQIPLKKLYKYENQPDLVGVQGMIREYISELEKEIKRCEKCIIDNGDDAPNANNMLIVRMQTLQEVIYDLEGRIEETD